MDKFTFVFQDGGQPVNSETKSQIRAHAMLGHLRQKFNTPSEDMPVTDTSCATQNPHPQKPTTNSYTRFRIHDRNSQNRKAAKRGEPIRCKPSGGSYITGNVTQGTICDQQNTSLLSFEPTDISSLIGSYPYDGVPPALSRKISYALQFHLNHHNVEARNLCLPIHPIFTEYLVRHFFSDRAAFLATTLKVLLFSAIEKQVPGSNWITKQNLLSLRRMTLEAISQQISMSPNVQDATICAIICLEMFESTLGSIDGPVHLRGLYHILAKDQSSMSHYDLFTRAISCLDAIDSVLRDSSRLFTTAPPTPYLSSFVCANDVDTAPPFWLNSPLRIVEGYGYLPDFIPVATLELLNDSFWLFKDFHDEVYNSIATPAQPEQDVQTHFAIHERLIRSKIRKADTIQNKVMEACRLSCFIQWRVLQSKIPHRHCHANRDDCKQLWVVLRETQVADWMQMPYVYLWVLLTGAASVESAQDDDTQHSRLDSTRGFFYYRILQFMLTLGLRWWDDFELILNNFCWLQKELRQMFRLPGTLEEPLRKEHNAQPFR